MVQTTGFSAGADTSAFVISYAQETVWGTLPAVAFTDLRATSESLSGQKARQRPGEMSAARQAAAAVTTQESAGGAVNFALSYGTYDDLLSGMLGGEWGTPLAINGVAADISTATTGNKLTSTTAGKFTAIQVGQHIRLAGFTNAANNGVFRVTAKTSAQDITLAGGTLVTETPAGTAAQVRGTMLRNGAVFKSFHFQKQFGSALFLRYPGCYVAGGSLGGGVGQFMNGSVNLVAREEAKAITDASTGAHVAAPTGRVHDTVAGFLGVRLDDTALPAAVESFTLNFANEGAAGQYAMGSAAAQGILPGIFTASGRLRLYFKDFVVYDRYKAEMAGNLSFRTLDAAGAGYTVSVLSAQILNPTIVAGGQGQSVLAEYTIEGGPDPVSGSTLQIDRTS